jgi:hypothetical protein
VSQTDDIDAQESVQMAFKGKPPGNGAGDISKRTEALRPVILLTAKQAAEARRMRREGRSPEDIAAAMDMPLDEIEKVLVQMRMPRPRDNARNLERDSGRARPDHGERQGDEPIWTTVDRILDELLRLRSTRTEKLPAAPPTHGRGARRDQTEIPFPLLAGLE